MSRRRSLEKVMQSELVTVSELVQLSGMRYSTLKYYTEIGLLPFVQLDAGLVRRYPRIRALERLEDIRSLKDKGLTIQQIVEHYSAGPVG
ncbi:MerR family transcriptional regulator [Cohnella zeiphila]|uniref:MerR family transcriptional regulator n=1 Tax=Cohnella zeiphila TaxID=2761120 RepID=A0A7X0STQ3_9BACL|nr:MerR family transcriptional regulator [Cohnella zeiphila]MBB6733713.1 MerR family transcriptional regulator [Cohnella zeiphila]